MSDEPPRVQELRRKLAASKNTPGMGDRAAAIQAEIDRLTGAAK